MAILKVARLGHPVLRNRAEDFTPEEILKPETAQLVDDMIATMHEYEGVGLAAPQVHVPKRLLIVEHTPGQRSQLPTIPLTILFNATITNFSQEAKEDWEGCLSIPNLRGIVPRANKIEIKGLDRQARPIKFQATGFYARTLQHEVDHLDGVVFLDRMPDMSSLMFNEEFYRYHPHDAD